MSDGLAWVLLAFSLLLGAYSGTVAAHALVIASQPGANDELAVGDVAVNLKFNSRWSATAGTWTAH